MSKQSKRNAKKPLGKYDNAVTLRPQSLPIPKSEFIPSGVINAIRWIEKEQTEREQKRQEG